MRKRVLPVLVMIVLGFGCLWLTAEPDPFAAPDGNPSESRAPTQVQVQVEFVELSHESLTTLLFLAAPKASDATTLRKQVQELVSKKEAKVIETMVTICKSGQKATTESLHEFIYPTKYKSNTSEELLKKHEEQMKGLGDFVDAGTATPTAFDTRNVGSVLEVEPTIGENDNIVDVRLVPEMIWHTGQTVWHEHKDKDGNVFKIQLPDFYTIRLHTSVSCISGQYTFVASLSPKDSTGELDMTRKVMVFVKCDILTVK